WPFTRCQCGIKSSTEPNQPFFTACGTVMLGGSWNTSGAVPFRMPSVMTCWILFQLLPSYWTLMFGCFFEYAGKKSLKKYAFASPLSIHRNVTFALGSFAPEFGIANLPFFTSVGSLLVLGSSVLVQPAASAAPPTPNS